MIRHVVFAVARREYPSLNIRITSKPLIVAYAVFID
jgi:hypothetical protein